MASGKKVTVGHKYFMNIQFAVGHAGIDELYEIQIGDRVAWSGLLTGPGTAVVDQEKLFGGEKREGGVAGLVDFMPGYADQQVNPALAAAVAQMTEIPVPAYRGITTMFFRGLDGNNMDGTPWQTGITADETKVTYSSMMKQTTDTSGGPSGDAFLISKIYEHFQKLRAFNSSFYWSAMNPYFKMPKFLMGRRWKGWYPERAEIGPDANPAHIIYECLTNKSWGMGYPVFDINDGSFRAAADRFFTEGFGLSLQWTNQTSIAEFVNLINEHINCSLIEDRHTGQWRLIPVRDDYVIGDLLQLDESNCTVEDFQRKSFSETINEVVVSFTRLDDGETDTIVVQDLANFAVQGKANSQKREYPGITNAELAARVAQRDLQVLSKPVAKVTLIANRAAQTLYPGQVFRLTWARLGIIDAVFRIGSMNLGSLQDNRIQIEAVEDVFGLPTNVYASPQPIGWVEPSRFPQPVVDHLGFELSYYEVYTRTTETERADWPVGTGIFAIAAEKPSSASVELNLYDDTIDLETGSGEFTPILVLAQDCAELDTTLYVSMLGVDMYEFVNVGLAWLDDELIEITAINTILSTVTVTRGAIDTLPRKHVTGATVWAYLTDFNVVIDRELREAGETINYKLLPETAESVLRVEHAQAYVYQMIDRLALPYPPGNVQVNTAYFPAVIGQDVTISWAHRDRTQQLAGVVGFTTGNIGPEVGVTYNLTIFGETDLLLTAQTGLTTTSYTYTTELEDTSLTAYPRTGIYVLLEPAPTGPDVVTPTDFITAYTFDGGNGNDVTGSASMSSTGTVSYPEALSSLGVYFNGAGYLEAFAADITVFPLSFSFWIKTTDIGNKVILEKDSTNKGFSIQLTSTANPVAGNSTAGCIQVNTRSSTDTIHSVKTVEPINDDVWHHVLVTIVEGQAIGIRIDGADTAVSVDGVAGSPLYNVFEMRMGARDSTTMALVGTLDEVRIYTRVLSTTEADALYTQYEWEAGHLGVIEEGPVVRLSERLRITIESQRDGLKSMRQYDHTAERHGYGFQYGMVT